MGAFEAECAAAEAQDRAEQALTVLRSAADRIWKIGLYAKDDPTQEDMMLLNYCCKVDLVDAHKMFMAVDALMEMAREQASEAAEAIRSMGGGALKRLLNDGFLKDCTPLYVHLCYRVSSRKRRKMREAVP